MVSVIICSRNADLLSQVSENISETIAVPYEIISINNFGSGRGICEVYNEGARKSKYPLLCFMHEDILMHTKGWGAIVKEILEDHTIGLLGVAGSNYKTAAPSPWWEPDSSAIRMNCIQHYSDTKTPVHEFYNLDEEIISEVVLVDGLWFCCRKVVWENNPFDEHSFKGFHLYDLDFSAQVFQKWRVCVTYKILLEHFSPGTIDKEWISATLAYSQKWKNKLPFFVNSQERKIRKENEWLVNKKFLEILIQHNYKINIQLLFLLKVWRFGSWDKQLLRLTKRVFRKII